MNVYPPGNRYSLETIRLVVEESQRRSEERRNSRPRHLWLRRIALAVMLLIVWGLIALIAVLVVIGAS